MTREENTMDPTDSPPVTTHSPSYARLALALSKAQGVMGGAKKDATNPHLKSKYADLASVWEACREPLAANGLAVAQLLESDGSKATVKTMLLHESGEYLETSITAKGKDDNIQTLGSIITYLRRYSLSAMVGIAPEDDDGQAGQGEQTAQNSQTKPVTTQSKGNSKSATPSEPIFNREAAVAEITVHMKRAGIGKDEMASWTKLKDYPPTTVSMTKEQLEHTLEYLKSHPDAA